MKQLTILGLGLWSKHLTMEAQECLQEENHYIILQTKKCYATAWLEKQGIVIESMDDCYEQSDDFDQLNHLIVHKLLNFLNENDQVIYAVPGSVQEISMQRQIFEACKQRDICVRIIDGIGLASAAQAAAGPMMGWKESARTISVVDIVQNVDSAHDAWCLIELDSRYWAAEAKLALMEYYSDDWMVVMAIAREKQFVFREVPIHQIDQQLEEDYSHRTCLLVGAVPFEQITHYSKQELMQILQRLRAPDGCPWDREQTHFSLRNTLVEESYELKEAIERNNDVNMIEELGDILMLVYFHTMIGEEQGRFSLEEIYTTVCEKLIYRHPHVFKENEIDGIQSIEQNQEQWDQLKRTEKNQKSYAAAVNDVPKAFPALLRAQKVLKRASDAGFDYSTMYTLEQLSDYFKLMMQGDREKAGELLFLLVDLLRMHHISAEELLSEIIDDFSRKFEKLEWAIIEGGQKIDDLSSADIQMYWGSNKNKPLTNRK